MSGNCKTCGGGDSATCAVQLLLLGDARERAREAGWVAHDPGELGRLIARSGGGCGVGPASVPGGALIDEDNDEGGSLRALHGSALNCPGSAGRSVLDG